MILYVLKETCEKLLLSTGNPVHIDGMDFPDVWAALDYIGSTKALPSDTLHLQADLEMLKGAFEQLPMHLNGLISQGDFITRSELTDIQETLEKFNNCFHVISPILQQVKILSQESKQLASKNVTYPSQPRLSPLFGARNRSPMPNPTVSLGDDAIARLSSMGLKLSTLERRVVGDGVSIGTYSFQSLEDVRSWCETHLPTKRFGLFLDGVSVFEFLAQDHTDTSKVLTNLYNSQKN
jgi:hypothetical protein